MCQPKRARQLSARGSDLGGLLEIVHLFIFFFQAEDRIRDLYVTGVQTCALPISARRGCSRRRALAAGSSAASFCSASSSNAVEIRKTCRVRALTTSQYPFSR